MWINIVGKMHYEFISQNFGEALIISLISCLLSIYNSLHIYERINLCLLNWENLKCFKIALDARL